MPLVSISIASIYTRNGAPVPLPARMARCAPDLHGALLALDAEVARRGGALRLSDLFRSAEMQDRAHADWKSGRKRAFSPPAGQSLHEAGRAFDLDLAALRMPLPEFWRLAALHGVVPIIGTPCPTSLEAWHFERPGSHAMVRDYCATPDGAVRGVSARRVMAESALLALGLRVPRLGGRQREGFVQTALIRLGAGPGLVDGLIGRRTRAALATLGLEWGDTADTVRGLEHLLRARFPEEEGGSLPPP